ncbi:MAG: hypothetical protein ACFCUR_01250 [Rhodomicrobiaceae bacterium]
MISGIATALISALIAVLAVSSANAASYTHTGDNFASVQTSGLLTLAGYYGRGHGDEDDDDGYDEPDGHQACGYTRYKKKYVCDQDEPRCFKQRECIWYWGREYCRYVRKCVGGKRYCRWVKTPVRSKCW